jgi:MFS family permease
MDVQAKQTPLPKLQLAVLLLIQAAEPITATVIYPFIPEFIRSTGITGGDEKKTGYYAGVVVRAPDLFERYELSHADDPFVQESCFFISEALVCFHWGRASDIFGRRPILLLGPLGLALSMFAFGLSKAFWPLVIFRCLQGTFNGNIGVSKTMMMEVSKK